MIDHCEPEYETADYCQCRLTRGNATRVSWIPVVYANLGKTIRLKSGEDWSDGWLVAEVYGKSTAIRIQRDEEFRRRMKRMSSIRQETVHD